MMNLFRSLHSLSVPRSGLLHRRLQWPRGSTCLVRMENVVFRLHGHMTRVSAIRGTGIGGELVGCGFVIVQRVSPSAAFRKSVAVLFHDESLREHVWNIHHEGGLCALLRLPLQLHDFGAIRESLAVTSNAGLVGVDHDRIGDDHLEYFV